MFDVEKQEVEIPKLRATLDELVADVRLVRGTKLANEHFMFASGMEEKLFTEIARKKPEEKEDWVDPAVLKCSTVRPFVLLRYAAAARPGHRHLAHLADVQ